MNFIDKIYTNNSRRGKNRLEEYKPTLPDSIGNLYKTTKTENESFDTISEAKKILETSLYGDMRKRLKDVLATQSSPLDTKNLFDDIDDDKITKSIPIAEAVIETNKKSGLDVSKYPYLKDGLTMMYAAGEAGNSREMQKAKKAAYMPLTGNIGDLKAITENAVLKGKSLAEPMKTETLIHTPGKDGDVGMTLYSEKLNFSDGKDKSSNPDGAGKREEPQKGVRFLGDILRGKEKEENSEAEKETPVMKGEQKIQSADDVIWSVPADFEMNETNRYGGKEFTKDYFSGDVDKLLLRRVWDYGSENLLRKVMKHPVSADMLEHALQDNPRTLRQTLS